MCLRSSSLRQRLKAFSVSYYYKSCILDITSLPDPHLHTIFGKVIFNLTQATVILFKLIMIFGRSYLHGKNNGLLENDLDSCWRLRSNSLWQKLMTSSVNLCHKELLPRCCRHFAFVSDDNTWQKVIFIWRKQPPNSIQ